MQFFLYCYCFLNGLNSGFDAFGDLLQPSGNAAMPGSTISKPGNVSTNKVLTGDLDSSLASLAMNLTINKSQTPKYAFVLITINCNNA